MKQVKQKPIKWYVYTLSLDITNEVTEGDHIWEKLCSFNSEEEALNFVQNGLYAKEFSNQVFVKYIQKGDHSIEEYLFKVEPCF